MTGTEQVQRLEALLEKIRRNASLLAQQRAEGVAAGSEQPSVASTGNAAARVSGPAAPSMHEATTAVPPSMPHRSASIPAAAGSTPPMPVVVANESAAAKEPSREMAAVAEQAAPEPTTSAASEEIEVIDADLLDDEMLVTIPPGAPDESDAEEPQAAAPSIPAAPPPMQSELPSAAPPSVEVRVDTGTEAAESRGSFPVPSEPPPMLEHEREFDVTTSDDSVEDDFRHSVPPPIDEIEAPPISTEQERGDEMDGLGVSLGFSPSQQPEAGDDDETEARRTPPPESGPQVSLAPKEAEGATHDAVARHGDGPTMEQLGATIDLDGQPTAEDLELAERAPSAPSAPDDFEAELPAAEFAGGYDASLSAPPNAREELAAHDMAERRRAERMSGPAAAPGTAPPPSSGAEPLHPGSIVPRPPATLSASAAIYESTPVRSRSAGFLDRLDASLSLGPSD